MDTKIRLNGLDYAAMLRSGAASLRSHVKEVNELNVFPIPDGDTGDNMLLTLMGGVFEPQNDELCAVSERVSGGMLLSARGNSGVILSQFFDGINRGFTELDETDAESLGEAFQSGVAQAYKAVMTPTEGTMLTVLREATEAACRTHTATPYEFLKAFAEEARASLERTPELLPVLKKAGVVDSGGAGIIYIIEGMLKALSGEATDYSIAFEESTEEPDLDAFDENSTLEFGYCTELLLRLQNAKTDINNFDAQIITDYLSSIGDSIVAVRNGSIVKLHVHTATPDKVLAFCQQYGEFLKVKIENMSLQHNSTVLKSAPASAPKARKKYGVVAVASGEGLKQTFLDRGADAVVDGGQCMNPSAEDFLKVFDQVNADTVFVFPNNGNIILTAKQAAELYSGADVRVIESHSIGDGYASLSMLDTGSGDTDAIVADLTDAMRGVITAEISHCIRDAEVEGANIHTGDYIGFVGKELLAVSKDRFSAVCETVDKLGLATHDICIVICGKESTEEEAAELEKYITSGYKGKEVYIIDGGQDIYDYILIVE